MNTIRNNLMPEMVSKSKSIRKQTDLSSRETNQNLLFSTFAFQQPICLSKLNRERYAHTEKKKGVNRNL
jgi:hypothetical protein